MKKFYLFLLASVISLAVFSQTPNVLRFKIVGGSGVDETLIRLKAGSTFGFDGNYDAFKLISNLVPQIYTLLPDATKLTINSVPSIETEYDFPLSIIVYSDGQYNINSTGLLSFNSSLGLFLIDQLSNITRNLKIDSMYTFNALVSQSSNRFLVRFIQRPLNPATIAATSISSTQIKLNVSSNSNNDNVIVVYNQTGAFTTPPDGVAPGGVNATFANGTVLYKGLSSAIPLHSNLNPNQHIFYKVFSCNYMNMFSAGITSEATSKNALSISQVNDFGSVIINTTSPIQSYTISGGNLLNNIVLFPSSNFEVSLLGGGNFTAMDSIVLTQIGGFVSLTNIFVRFKPTAMQSYSQQIINVSNGADTSFLPVTGIGLNPLKSLTLTLFLEGLYSANIKRMNQTKDGNTGLAVWGDDVADKINIELCQGLSPFSLQLAINDVDLTTDGVAKLNISAEFSGNYYIKVKHRNHLQIWSSVPVSFAGGAINYDFTVSSTQAYQIPGGIDPQVQVSNGVYALYLGDLDQGGWVDSEDLNIFEPNLTIGAIGFVSSDFDGNGLVDSEDFNLFELRLTAGVYAQFP